MAELESFKVKNKYDTIFPIPFPCSPTFNAAKKLMPIADQILLGITTLINNLPPIVFSSLGNDNYGRNTQIN